MAKISIANQAVLTQEYLHSVLDYNPETGAFTWKQRPGSSSRLRTWNTKYAGKQTGYILNNGYIQITINASRYSGHRLAWFYMHGVWPAAATDHRNGIRADNRIANIRPATQSQNCQNRGVMKDSKTGFKGVFLYIKGNCRKYVSRIKVKDKILNLGRYDTPQEAYNAYCEAAKKHHGEFARL